MTSAVAIRHVCFEGLDAFAPAHYWGVGEQDLWTLEPVKTALLVVLGGPISTYEEEAYPFLSEEIGILQQRLDADWLKQLQG